MVFVKMGLSAIVLICIATLYATWSRKLCLYQEKQRRYYVCLRRLSMHMRLIAGADMPQSSPLRNRLVLLELNSFRLQFCLEDSEWVFKDFFFFAMPQNKLIGLLFWGKVRSFPGFGKLTISACFHAIWKQCNLRAEFNIWMIWFSVWFGKCLIAAFGILSGRGALLTCSWPLSLRI